MTNTCSLFAKRGRGSKREMCFLLGLRGERKGGGGLVWGGEEGFITVYGDSVEGGKDSLIINHHPSKKKEGLDSRKKRTTICLLSLS